MKNRKQWGAEPCDWDTFLDNQLMADILPVVSNPGAEISANSTMRGMGKTPSIYNRGGYVAGFPKWTSFKATQKDINTWREQPDYGICIQTRYVRAFDIDIEDEHEAQAIVGTIHEMLGFELPRRYRDNSNKCLLAFRLPGEFGKQVIKTVHGIVEILANGQQFIAAGTHTSGVRYQWNEKIDDGIPEVSQKQFDAITSILESEFAIVPSTQRKVRKKGVNTEISTDSTIHFLEDNGYVLEYGSEGQAHIECPFSSEHTADSAVSSTSYFPAGSRGYDRGNFICLHAHCEGRKITEFENALGITAADFEDLSSVNGRKRFEVIPLDEFVSMPPPPWMIKGLLPETGLAMIFGASGSGKSFLAIDIVEAIARGVDWCGRKTKKGSVVYIAAEGVAGIRSRFKAYTKHHEVNLNDLYIGMIQDTPNLHQNDCAALISAIKDYGEVQVIVIDTLAQISPGADENSAKDMGAVLSRCKKIQEETGALVILIHHSGKNEKAGARGWSGMFAAMDTVIRVSAKGDVRKAILEKQKDGEGGFEFPFKLEPVFLGWDEDDEEITSCIVAYTFAEEETVELTGKWQQSIIRVMQELELCGDPIFIKDLIATAVDCHSYDPGADLAKPIRDRRAESLKRALKQICNMGFLIIVDDIVSFPQTHKEPQNR